jgi:hypothetical protein
MLCICWLSWRATTNRYPSWERGQKEMEIMPLPVFRSDWKNPCPQTPCNYLCLILIILSCALRQVKAPWVRDILKLQTVSLLWPCPIPLFGRRLPPGALPYTSIGAFGVCRRSTMGGNFIFCQVSLVLCALFTMSLLLVVDTFDWVLLFWVAFSVCVCFLFCSILWCSWSGYNPWWIQISTICKWKI